MAAGVNPVRKVPLLVSGNGDTLVIAEFVSYGDDDEDDGHDENGNADGIALGGTRY